MGYYSEYLDQNMNLQTLSLERKRQLIRISELRGGHDVIVYAADLNKGMAPITISYDDLLAVKDQLSNLSGEALDLILETPGGSGEVAEDIIRLLRSRYDKLAVIVPGYAKSAGTIMAMAGDEILMEPASSLGPIDAQMAWQGKTFSAHALLEGMKRLKAEVDATGSLNKAYIPILQGMSLGELQSAENSLTFAESLVTDWLVRYKFKNWTVHSSNGKAVTAEEKNERANTIATELCNQSHWLTHGRSIKVEDFDKMKLLVTDYTKDPKDAALAEAIQRYYTLLQLTFATNIYKVYETSTSQVYRFASPMLPGPPPGQSPDVAVVEVMCNNCRTRSTVQANLDKKQPLRPGCVAFPADNRLKCAGCGTEIDLSDLRRQIELQTKKKVMG